MCRVMLVRTCASRLPNSQPCATVAPVPHDQSGHFLTCRHHRKHFKALQPKTMLKPVMLNEVRVLKAFPELMILLKGMLAVRSPDWCHGSRPLFRGDCTASGSWDQNHHCREHYDAALRFCNIQNIQAGGVQTRLSTEAFRSVLVTLGLLLIVTYVRSSEATWVSTTPHLDGNVVHARCMR